MRIWTQTLRGLCGLTLLAAAGCQGDRAGAEGREPEPSAYDRPREAADQPAAQPESPAQRIDEQQGAQGAAEPKAMGAGAMTAAVDGIVQARCDREERCDNIGSGKKFASRSLCETEVRAEWRSDLNAFECPQGVDENQLDKCKAQLRAEACDSVLDTLGRLAACRTNAICKD